MAWGRELGLTAAGGERIAVEGVAPRCWPSEVPLSNTFCGQDVVGGGQSYLNKISRINKKRGGITALSVSFAVWVQGWYRALVGTGVYGFFCVQL